MNPVKITAELTLTPEKFKKWCDGDFEESERMYRHYVEKMVYHSFGVEVDYQDFVDKEICKLVSGVKFTFEKLK